jgi:toxin ParE1/3/4
MSSKVTRKPEVKIDLIELADYISHDNLDAALRFLDAAENTFVFLATHHEAGQLCNFRSQEARGVRVWRVDGFKNHLIFYCPTNDGIDVVRVLHGARDIEAIFSEPE